MTRVLSVRPRSGLSDEVGRTKRWCGSGKDRPTRPTRPILNIEEIEGVGGRESPTPVLPDEAQKSRERREGRVSSVREKGNSFSEVGREVGIGRAKDRIRECLERVRQPEVGRRGADLRKGAGLEAGRRLLKPLLHLGITGGLNVFFRNVGKTEGEFSPINRKRL